MQCFWRRLRLLTLSTLCVVLAPSVGRAEVTRLDVESRQDVLNGRPFGAAGAYEWVLGTVRFAVDPAHPRNQNITDITLAPRNTSGRVEFSAEVMVLRPKDPQKGNGVVIFDVANRGRPQVLSYLNMGTGADRAAEAYLGDGLLLRQGFTLVWLGWQQDLPAPRDLLHLSGPVLAGVTGMTYSDLQPTTRALDLPVADRGMTAYRVLDVHAQDNQLARRPSRDGPPEIVPREQWGFGRVEAGRVVDDPTRIYLRGGFEPGVLYQLAYRAREPYVTGLGLAAVRDLMSWVRYEPSASVRGTHVYAFGISQSGRFLRQFLHDGFNADTGGRQVFEGMMIHIAGGSSRGFNERLTLPSLNGTSRVFPFTDNTQADRQTGISDGLLSAATRDGVVPKIIYTSSSWEYWGSVASGLHTTIDGTADVALPETSRVFLLAGTQHVPAAFPPRFPAPPPARPVTGAELVAQAAEPGQLRLNPLNYRPVLRALFTALDQWVREGVVPPSSRVPTVKAGTLVSRDRLNTKGYSTINVPAGPQVFARLDTPEPTHGVFATLPPRRGQPYPALVPQVDDDGNDLSGVRVPELAVPLATHTGWSLRDPSIGNPTDLVQQAGSYLPLSRTRADRVRAQDLRPSIEERYASVDVYLGRIAQAANRLVEQRLLLPDDVSSILRSAETHWRFAMAEP